MTYVYVVQDHEREIRGVWSSLAQAKEMFVCVMSELMTSDEFQEYQQMIQNGESDLWGPWIMVYTVDSGCVWSYETIEEINNALLNGEQYDE